MMHVGCEYNEIAFIGPLVLAYIVGMVIGAVFINE